jgi:hypothetical protein
MYEDMFGSLHETHEVLLMPATLLAILCCSEVGINLSCAHCATVFLLDNQSLKAGFTTLYAST